jgi:quinoprotein glucose dehydrogenase
VYRHQRLFALDAATGKEKWHFDPQLNANPSFQHVTCRGVSYHEARADNASPEVVPTALAALCCR